MDTATDHEQGKGFELRLVSLLYFLLTMAVCPGIFFPGSQVEEKLNLL